MDESAPKRRVGGCEDLLVWQRSIALVKATYALTRALPGDERFGLTSQARRAAVSVAANIAEGHARLHRGDFVRHVSIARASLAELHTHVVIAVELGYLAQQDTSAVVDLADHVGRMLTKLLRNLPPADTRDASRDPLLQHTARKNSSQSRIP